MEFWGEGGGILVRPPPLVCNPGMYRISAIPWLLYSLWWCNHVILHLRFVDNGTGILQVSYSQSCMYVGVHGHSMQFMDIQLALLVICIGSSDTQYYTVRTCPAAPYPYRCISKCACDKLWNTAISLAGLGHVMICFNAAREQAMKSTVYICMCTLEC